MTAPELGPGLDSSPAVVLVAAVLGGLGAVVRAEVAAAARRRGRATTIVNVGGAFLLGVVGLLSLRNVYVAESDHLVIGHLLPSPTALTVLGAGFCGGLTTFSTWMVEATERSDDVSGAGHARRLALPVVLGVVAVLAGSLLSVLLWPENQAAVTSGIPRTP